MKLVHFERLGGYLFRLGFANGEYLVSDLEELIGKHVAPEGLSTARLDGGWGCLEFDGGRVDIEPKTLYRYAKSHPAGEVEREPKIAA